MGQLRLSRYDKTGNGMVTVTSMRDERVYYRGAQ